MLSGEAATRVELLCFCAQTGVPCDLQKSELQPTQVLDFVDLHFNLSTRTVSVTKKNVLAGQEVVQRFTHKESVTAWLWRP